MNTWKIALFLVFILTKEAVGGEAFPSFGNQFYQSMVSSPEGLALAEEWNKKSFSELTDEYIRAKKSFAEKKPEPHLVDYQVMWCIRFRGEMDAFGKAWEATPVEKRYDFVLYLLYANPENVIKLEIGHLAPVLDAILLTIPKDQYDHFKESQFRLLINAPAFLGKPERLRYLQSLIGLLYANSPSQASGIVFWLLDSKRAEDYKTLEWVYEKMPIQDILMEKLIVYLKANATKDQYSWLISTKRTQLERLNKLLPEPAEK